MNKFCDFNIKPISKGFEGDKIKMNKVLNRTILVHDFKIVDSKIFPDRGTGLCMHLQISISGEKFIIFTSSSALIEAIKQVPEYSFPFQTTIIQENERYLFT